MKTNYINQLQRSYAGEDLPKGLLPNNEEQSVHISMEDAAIKYVKNEYQDMEVDGTILYNARDDFKAGWQEREQQLLPIIKEMGEALKKIQDNYDNVEDLAGVIARTALDKYKNLL